MCTPQNAMGGVKTGSQLNLIEKYSFIIQFSLAFASF
jgi:hypothetical protein